MYLYELSVDCFANGWVRVLALGEIDADHRVEDVYVLLGEHDTGEYEGLVEVMWSEVVC